MFNYLRKIFSDTQDNSSSYSAHSAEKSEKNKIEIAACALFIEMANADGNFSNDERDFIISEMKKTFDLDDECVNELIELAEQKIKDSISLYEFTSTINSTFRSEEKLKLLESLWKLIYKDEKLNMYEDHLIKKIAAIMNIEHKQIIQIKLSVKEQMGLR